MTNNEINFKIFDLIGIGIGAFNLGLAALMQKTNLTYKFLDLKESFDWHDGMLLENAKLQVHFLKDLASCVDPANPYTFLSYLSEKGRIYQFLNRKQSVVSRHEFSDYFKWAAAQIPNLCFGEKILDVRYSNNLFNIITKKSKFFAKNIVVGTGRTPYIPIRFREFLSKNFFHNYKFKQSLKELDFANKRIAIIGGGQSGAEVFDTLISFQSKPKEIIWASKRVNFQTLEDSCFANEFYTPNYVKYFYSLPSNLREQKLDEQRLTSDGITQELSNEIYNKLYELKYLRPSTMSFELLPHQELSRVIKKGDGYLITLFNKEQGDLTEYTADIVILATGYQSCISECLKNLPLGISNTKSPSINIDYSVNWRCSSTNKIFLQNGARLTHGVADPNLSLAAWRNAIIINSLSNEQIYKVDTCEPIVNINQFNILQKSSLDANFSLEAA